MPRTKVSMREISRKTGYSPATISNALNNKPGVSESTAEEIRRIAQELGYQRGDKLQRIQFVIGRRSGRMIDEGSFRLAVINGIDYEATKHGIPITYTTLQLTDEALCARQLSNILSDQDSGIILLGTEMTEADYDLFADVKVPLVVVDGLSDNHFFESIVFSNEGSSYRAVRYLIECGHKEIGYLAGSLRIRNFPLRDRGYRRALEEAGLPVRDEFRVTLDTDKLEAAYHDMKDWLKTNPKLPTAFFADNDALAVGAMRAIIEAGYSIPGDISVMGFDDVEFAAVSQPPLTTVHVPRFDIGRMAAIKLIGQAEAREPFTCVTHVSTALVKRDSVGPAA